MVHQRIDSPQNPRIKAAAELREKKARQATGLFCVEGIRELARAMQQGFAVDEIFICEEILAKSKQALPKLTATTTFISERAFAKLAMRENKDGIFAILKQKTWQLADLIKISPGLILVVEGLEKPGNLGAILRSADGAGCSGVIVLDNSVDAFHPQVIRNSIGCVFSVPTVWTDAASAKKFFAANSIQVFVASPEAKESYSSVDFSKACAILLGSEADGVSAAWRDQGCTLINIPMHGIADSLNVSVSGAILLYEARRQRS